MISRKTIDEVFDTARIEEVVGDFLNLKRKGSNLVGLCPFHDEKTPSFMVSPSKNIYKCFGCGRGGGAVQFVIEHEKYTYPEAIRYLAEKYGIAIDETRASEEDIQEQREMESLFLVNEFAIQLYENTLWDTPTGKSVGLSYFKERGFLESTIRKFQLGFAPNDPAYLKKKALAKGFTKERLQNLGLVTKNDNDFFRDRVIFPIHNLSGKTIAFAGRALRSGPKAPKYLNSPESPIYNKRKVLYALHLAKHGIRKADLCYLVEGYTDVISMYQSGIENVVASSGTALTPDQVKAIKRFTDNITVIYDGDEAGVKAAMRGLDLMLEQDVNVRLVLLPASDDPDSMVKRLGGDAFREYLEDNAHDFVLFKAKMLGEESARDPIRRSQVIKDIVQSIGLVPDPIKRSVYIQECAIQLGVDEQILIQEVNKSIRDNLKRQRLRQQSQRRQTEDEFRQMQVIHDTKPPETEPIVYSDHLKEAAIAKILLLYGHLNSEEAEEQSVAEYVLINISDFIDTFRDPIYSRIIHVYQEHLGEGTLPSRDLFLNDEDPAMRDRTLDLIIPKYDYSENWEKLRDLPLLTQLHPDANYMNDCEDSILRFKHAKIYIRIEENKKAIRAANESLDQEKLEMHLKLHNELLKTKGVIEEALNTVGIRLSNVEN